MYQEAIFLVNRAKHQYPYEGSDKPKQNGLAYGWGNKNHKVRRSPSLSKSICTHKIYGLDCSGFVSQVFSGAGINTNESYNAETLRKGVVLQEALWESFPDLKKWKFIDYGKLAVNELKSGDIVYWLSQNKSGKMYASHIGVVFMHKEKDTDEMRLVVFQSNGTPDGCVFNLQITRGPRKIELTDNYWFGSKKQYGITRLASPLSQVKTKPVVSNQKLSGNDRLTITTGGDIMDAGGSSIMTKGVCWSTNYPPTVEHSKTNEGPGFESYFSNISGLEPYTTYYIRAYTKNEDGYSYGNLITYKTGGPGGTNGEPCPGAPTVTDVDGNVYNTVLIGDQCWMASNLKTTNYSNGKQIPNITDSNWSKLTFGAYVWYDNDIKWAAKYGALYNWYSVIDTNGLCPKGWHIPSYSEMSNLIIFIGGIDAPNGNKLKSCRQIDSPLGGDCSTNEHPRWSANGENYGANECGFSFLPGGHRDAYGQGKYYNKGLSGGFWANTKDNTYEPDFAWTLVLWYNRGDIDFYPAQINGGRSIRCIKD
jgi:uncharacterized protein (TIGR02145 family)